MFTVTKEFSFEAAHSLPCLPPAHKCHNLHGHSYRVEVICESKRLQLGRHWVVDYAEISKAVEPLIAHLDHQNLNQVLPCPTTAENLARWFYEKLEAAGLPHLAAVAVRETEKTNVIYRPGL